MYYRDIAISGIGCTVSVIDNANPAYVRLLGREALPDIDPKSGPHCYVRVASHPGHEPKAA